MRPARGRRDLADWEQCRAGDAGFGLVGLLFDMELWPQGEPAGQPRGGQRRLARERAGVDVAEQADGVVARGAVVELGECQQGCARKSPATSLGPGGTSS